MQQIRAELLAHPVRAVAGAGDRLDVEVVACEQPAAPDLRIDGDSRVGAGAVAREIAGAVGADRELDGFAVLQDPFAIVESRKSPVLDKTWLRGAIGVHLEPGRDLVEAEHVVRGVTLGAVAVVRKGRERAVWIGEQSGPAGDWLLVHERRRHSVRGRDELPGSRTWTAR